MIDPVKRIQDMSKYPEMWAWSEEAFLMQVALCLEFASMPSDLVRAWMYAEAGRGFLVMGKPQEITPGRAVRICASALLVLEDYRYPV